MGLNLTLIIIILLLYLPTYLYQTVCGFDLQKYDVRLLRYARPWPLVLQLLSIYHGSVHVILFISTSCNDMFRRPTDVIIVTIGVHELLQ